MSIHIKNLGECQCCHCGVILPKGTKPAGKKDLYRITNSNYLLLGANCSYIQADIEYYECKKCSEKQDKTFTWGCLVSIIIAVIVGIFAYRYIGDVFITGMLSLTSSL